MKIDKTTIPYRGFLIDGMPVQPMTELESKVMVSLILGGRCSTWDELKGIIFGDDAQEGGHFLGKIMYKRLEHHFNIEDILTPQTFMMISCLESLGSPAIAVMWAYTLGLMAAEHEAPIDMSTLCRIYPWGLPTPEAMLEQWDMQKGYMQEPQIALDNMLDTPLWWERINKVITDRKAMPLSE